MLPLVQPVKGSLDFPFKIPQRGCLPFSSSRKTLVPFLEQIVIRCFAQDGYV
jgi:hypothetical protein